HREEEDQHIADEEFRQYSRGQRDARNRLVNRAVAVAGGKQPEQDRERHRDGSRAEDEEQRVSEPLADRRGEVATVRKGRAENFGQYAPQPTEIAHDRRIVEPQLGTKVGQGLRRRRLAEYRGSDVSGKDLRPREDQHRYGEEEENAQRNALGDQFQDERSPHKSGLLRRCRARLGLPPAGWTSRGWGRGPSPSPPRGDRRG